MKKLYAILFLTAVLGTGERSNAAGSRLMSTLRTTAPRYFSTGKQAIKPQPFGSRFDSQSKLFSTTPKAHTFTARSIPKVGPSLSQQAALLARRYYKPAAKIGAGALGTYAGSKYLTSRAPDMNIFRPSVVLAEEANPVAQEFQEIEELVNRGLFSKDIFIPLSNEEPHVLSLLVDLGDKLIEAGDVTAENKQKYLELFTKAMNQQEESLVRGLDKDFTERAGFQYDNPYTDFIERLALSMLPRIHLAKSIEDLDVTRFTIPKGVVNALKRLSTDKGHEKRIKYSIEKKKRMLQDLIADDRSKKYYSPKSLKNKLAVYNAIEELIDKDFPEKDGYIIYSPTSSWIPWNWFGY